MNTRKINPCTESSSYQIMMKTAISIKAYDILVDLYEKDFQHYEILKTMRSSGIGEGAMLGAYLAAFDKISFGSIHIVTRWDTFNTDEDIIKFNHTVQDIINDSFAMSN